MNLPDVIRALKAHQAHVVMSRQKSSLVECALWYFAFFFCFVTVLESRADGTRKCPLSSEPEKNENPVS